MTVVLKKRRGARFTPAGRLYLQLLKGLEDYSVDEMAVLCRKYKERRAALKRAKGER